MPLFGPEPPAQSRDRPYGSAVTGSVGAERAALSHGGPRFGPSRKSKGTAAYLVVLDKSGPISSI